MPYLKLMRFHFHISFISVIAGALLFCRPGTQVPWLALLQCYVLFNVLMYGGIYTFNDIVDINADAAHETKKHRPLPSGQVGIGQALLFCTFLIGVALYFSWRLFSREILWVLVAFIAATAAYTLALKRIPYAGLSIVALTHTLRLVLGILIAGAVADLHFCAAFYVMLFCIAVTIHGTYNARAEEKKYYPPWMLIGCQVTCAAFVAGLAAWSGRLSAPWLVLVAVFSLFVLCSHLHCLHHPIARLFMVKEKKN